MLLSAHPLAQPNYGDNTSIIHQCLIQWDGDEVEVVHADDSIEVSRAAMSVWDAEDQEPISGISLEGCDRVEATKNGVRLVLSTGLTEQTGCQS
jgi:hypothetical protein